MDSEAAIKGHFYVVGVGPGAPDLLTLRAANIIRSCDVLIAPRAESSTESLALQVATACIDRQEVIEQVYPMARDERQTESCWAGIADMVVERCERGQAVAHLTIGDPLLYSTAGYLIDQIAGRLPEERWHVVPGISAFQAAAAAARQTLTRQDDRLLLMPATSPADVQSALDACETLVLYKVGRRLKPLIAALEERGLDGQATLVSHASQPGRESIRRGLGGVCDPQAGYMSTVIVRLGRRGWLETSEPT
jgi:precorrin-2/cobalt-factor-2 C20-methyltransferase